VPAYALSPDVRTFFSGNLPTPTQNHTTFKIAVDSATTSMENHAIPFFQSEISQLVLKMS
jgi:hypothetical protein